jgi:hypothetical protein
MVNANDPGEQRVLAEELERGWYGGRAQGGIADKATDF